MAVEREDSFVTETDRLALESRGEAMVAGPEGLSRIVEVLDFGTQLTEPRRDILFQVYADTVASRLAGIDAGDISRLSFSILGASDGLVEFLTNAVDIIQDKESK